ncbi:ATP-binding protein [Lysinibacillus fusiformis]|uniref:ATP-binding protein n=1 Tax=Lysinibacillus fusiformis TaxID=28031 RepID=UPI000E33537B|nr:ATP-binding protein [Lysinibacillus fusiformis]AXQ50901.1 ATP-binding protein [Stenotrophomonas rhizophila]KAB0447228.1 transposase [Lysinibacillus fusiformis]
MKNGKTIELENGIEVLLAEYREQETIDYKGNPLIEALPPILSKEEAFDQLSFLPMFHNSERNLSSHHRYHALLRLSRFYQPINQTLNLEQRFSGFIRYGYVNRNPLHKKHVQALLDLHNKLVNKEEFGLPPDIRSSASSFTLMGYPGIGKTSAIERVLSLYPQVILHQNPINLIQIVWLKLNCPHDGSLKTLCMDFFKKVDSLIGTNYFEKYGKPSNSVSSMVTRMGQVARLHSIGALIIDEIQHLLSASGTASEMMMNFFVTLVNEIGVPVMFIGTMKAKALLQKDFRQARRSSGQGDMVWQQMKQDDDWEVLITSMWDYQWTNEYTELTEELLNTVYEESQGIVDVAVKLYLLAQARAIDSGIEKITPQLIRKVAKEDLRLLQPMLEALKSGNPSDIAKYEDIVPIDIEEYILNRMPVIDLKARVQVKKEKMAQDRTNKELPILEKLILSLINLDVPEKIAESAAKYALKKSPESTIPQLMTLSLQYIEEKKEKKEKKNEANISVNKLQSIVDKGKKNKRSAYEALCEEGYIKNPLDDLII